MQCKKFYGPEAVFNVEGVPTCECGGIIKPDVVLYEEGLNQEICSQSIEALLDADMLIVGGTSLTVYPASGFIRYFHGKNLVIINRSTTPYDQMASLVMNQSLGSIFQEIEV